MIKTEKWTKPTFNKLEKPDSVALSNIEDFYQQFQQPFAAIEQYVEMLKKDIAKIEATAKKHKTKKAEKDKQLKPLKDQIAKLTKPLKAYRQAVAPMLAALQQATQDWKAFHRYFPDATYRDVEGLCKVVDLAEIKEQEYSLTPGRYVGVAVDIDMDFDYQGRMAEIHAELAKLNVEANILMKKILI